MVNVVKDKDCPYHSWDATLSKLSHDVSIFLLKIDLFERRNDTQRERDKDTHIHTGGERERQRERF